MLAAAIRAASTPVIHQQVVRHLDYLTGLENIPRTEPVVIVANHSSYADHFMTLTLLHALRPGQVWYPTKAEAFETLGSRVWHESMNCFSVQRDAPSDAIFIKAKEVLDAGNILVLYPEGTRGPGDQLLPFKSGAFRMALASGAPVVPIGMWNLHRVLPKGSSRVTNEVAAVAIGSALHITQAEPREAITTMRHDAQRAIEALILQARSATAADRAQAAIHIADLMGQIVLENLDARGNLPAEVRQRPDAPAQHGKGDLSQKRSVPANPARSSRGIQGPLRAPSRPAPGTSCPRQPARHPPCSGKHERQFRLLPRGSIQPCHPPMGRWRPRKSAPPLRERRPRP